MSDSERREPALSEVTGTFHYQQLIESRLGQPIAADQLAAEVERLAASPGAKLVAARNALGWSVEQVAAQLKMAPRQIQSMERDDYAALPDPTIVRGFMRAYAKLLKIDPNPILALLAADFERKNIHQPGKKPAQGKRASIDDQNRLPNNSPLSTFTLIALIAIAAALAYAYFSLPH